MNQADTRVVECARCGAPVGARVQTQATCSYCGAITAVAARPNDAKRVPSQAEEIARLSRLKAQQDHSVPGHVYDLEAFPPALTAQGASPALAENLPALEQLWPWAKGSAAAGVEAQRALLWIVLQMAKRLRHAGRGEQAQARLETSLDLLPDPGHRLLVRTDLARAAIAAGKIQEAATWLTECDPAPEVLELDSALRYASARLRLAQGDAPGALGLVGAELDTMPWAKAFLPYSILARVHAYELMGNTAKAEQLWTAGGGKSQTLPLIDVAQAEGLAPRTRLKPLGERARQLQRQIRDATTASGLLSLTVLWTPVICLILSFLAMIEGCTTKRGPLLGATAPIVCPLVCEGCQPPLTYGFWSTSTGGRNSSSHHVVLCDTKAQRPSTMTSLELLSYKQKFPHQEVPFGAPLLFAVSYLILFFPSLFPALLLSLRHRSKLRAKLDQIRAELIPIEAELRANGALEAAQARVHSREWSAPLLLCLLLAVVMASCTGIGFGFCTSSPPAASTR